MFNMVLLDFAKAFKHERFVLNIFGLYPGRNSATVGNFVIQLLYITAATIQFIFALIQMCISKDYTVLIDCGIFFISITNFIFKAVVLHLKKNVLESITTYLERIDGSKIPVNILHKLKNHEVVRGKLGAVYRLAIVLYLLLQVLIVVFKQEDKFLPLKSWTPFDLNVNLIYNLTFIFQLSVIGILITCDTSLDCLYYVLADVACCQLDILKENLKKINPRGCLNVKQELIKCIKYHQWVIEFVHKIEKVFSIILFLEFFKSIINICFIGFELTMVKFLSLHFFMRFIYLNGLLLEIFSFCWFGHVLILKSTEVEDACYLIDWHECSISVQKIIWMIMIRSNKPLVVRALFLTITMSTLTLILKSSYSYATVLRTMYD